MTTQEQYIERLKEMTIIKFGRDIAAAEDCALLAEAISEVTNVAIERRSLELLFLAKRRSITPRPIVLSLLARYVGYSDWSSFCSSSDVLPAADVDIIPTTRRWGVIILTCVAMAIVIGAALFLVISTPDHSSEEGVRSPLEEQIYESVMERWEAIALEECNALRRYSNEQDYIDHIERHISERSMTLEQRISEDVVLRATELGVILDASTSEELSKEIVDRCLAIYQCLHTECY